MSVLPTIPPAPPPVKIDSQEAPFVCFTELRKKVGEDEYAVLHFTIRDQDDARGSERVSELIESWVAKGWSHADSPKAQRSWGGGGGKGGKPKKVEIPADGRFEVRAFVRAHFADKDNIRVYGVNGEECVAWEGRSLKEFLSKNVAVQPVQDAFGGWSSWALDQEHPVQFQNNAVIAQCEKSQKSGTWYVKELRLESKNKGG